MFELIAEGSESHQRWKHALADGRPYVLGRGAACDLVVSWDSAVSRTHVRVTATDARVRVERLAEATNPLCHAGEIVEHCDLRSGDQFVLGSTLFHLYRPGSEPSASGDPPLHEVTFDAQTIRQIRFRDAERQMEVLMHLPEVISGARTDDDLFFRLTSLLLAGVSQAEAVGIVRLKDGDQVELANWTRRRETAGEFRPSSRLVTEALKRRCSVLHLWPTTAPQNPEYTAAAELDWAFCTPVPDGPQATWGLYVAGKQSRPLANGNEPAAETAHLQADVKFSELVAEIISSVRRLSWLERQQAGLRQFFAPTILSALGNELNTEVLAPRECDVTVMFCDLRGFSQHAEQSAGDLIGLLNRVSQALGVMTSHILQHRGVTGDFQGDSALGFWGWPFSSDESTLQACRAALGIRKVFAESFQKSGHPLANFQMGIGLAHGPAVAGKIGTAEQVKVTVFGPVVNLASRLETMTSQLRVPILLDESLAMLIRERLDPSEGRVRRLAKVLPVGFETPVLVSELVPPVSDLPELTDAHLARYEQGVSDFIDGRWEAAYRCLHDMPATDRAQDFLLALIAQHNRQAPADWDGVVRLKNK
ncbi:MAG: adenylate/guanylate cyclase domain-containing protein [Planctomycetaceae bacterium]